MFRRGLGSAALTGFATVCGVTAPDALRPGPRLGIDFGTTHTVAALAGAGPPQPLLFDASFLLPSAVYAETDGRLLVGQDAVRSARLDPTRFEPNPKRRIDEGRLLLGSREYNVTDAIGAVLRRVADEAARVAGALPAATVLTYPAAWAGQRRAVLATAASEAGLPAVTLMPEPVAAAVYLTAVLGHRVEPGGLLAVYDFGGGTFDASVLRREPDGGWTTLAADGLPELGGVDLDGAIVEHLGRSVGAREPALWRRLTQPDAELDRRRHRMLWDDVRLAKEQLSRTSSAALHVPLFDVDVHLTREEFERIARPYLERTADLTAGLLQRAGVRADQLAGVFPVGGSSRIPLAGTLLHHRLGVAPTLIEQPELVVALGSLSKPPVTGTAMTGAIPVSGVPMSAFPVSGAPISGAPSSAPPAPTPVSPASPVHAASPAQPPAKRTTKPTRRRSLALLGGVAVLVLAILGASKAYRSFTNVDQRHTPGAVGSDAAKPGDPRQTVPMNKTAWYAGWEIAFGKATYDKSKSPSVTITATAKNLNPSDNRLEIDATLASHNSYATARAEGSPTVPGGQASNITFGFDVQELPGSLADAMLTFGDAKENQTVVPLGSGPATVHRPYPVFGSKPLTLRDLQFKIKHCDITGDVVTQHKQAPAKQVVLSCWLDAKYLGPARFHYLDENHLRLLLPDGTAAGPVEHPIQNLDKDVLNADRFYAFYVTDPPAGQYTLQFVDVHTFETIGPKTVMNVPLTVPSSPPAPSAPS
jgi:hypothetical protein